MKQVLVLGASTDSQRYSNKAIRMLRSRQYPVIAVGRSEGQIGDVHILTELPVNEPVDTVTLYLNPVNQRPFYQQLLSLKPRRIIFNPGTENEEFEKLAQNAGIQTDEACTLVLLSTGQF